MGTKYRGGGGGLPLPISPQACGDAFVFANAADSVTSCRSHSAHTRSPLAAVLVRSTIHHATCHASKQKQIMLLHVLQRCACQEEEKGRRSRLYSCGRVSPGFTLTTPPEQVYPRACISFSASTRGGEHAYTSDRSPTANNACDDVPTAKSSDVV